MDMKKSDIKDEIMQANAKNIIFSSKTFLIHE